MIDSSRYVVVRVVDTASGRHAFVGLGFREREAASDFNAALYDHLQYVRRKKTAHEARLQYEEQQRQRAVCRRLFQEQHQRRLCVAVLDVGPELRHHGLRAVQHGACDHDV